jgi:hypothetical protein
MSSLFNPQGFQIDQHQSGIASPMAIDNAIPQAGLAYNIFYGQPVTIDATTGYIARVTATSDRIYGIFCGIEYATNNAQALVSAKRYYAANTTLPYTLAAYGSQSAWCRVFVYNTPDMLFRAQFSNSDAETPLFTNTPVGGQFNLDVTTTTVTQVDGTVFPVAGNATAISLLGSNTSSVSPNNIVTGISYACLNPTAVTGGSVGQFIVVDIVREPRNSATDAFPIVRVRINNSSLDAPRTSV